MAVKKPRGGAAKKKAAPNKKAVAKKKPVKKKKPAEKHGRGHIPQAEFERELRLAHNARARARLLRPRPAAADATRTRARRRRGLAAPALTAEPAEFDPRAGGVRLSGPVRNQPPGDERCSAFAVAGAMETWLCRTNGSVAGLAPLSTEHAFEQGNEQRALSEAAKGAAKGVLEEACFEASPPCQDVAKHTWRGTVRVVGEEDPDLPTVMRQLLLRGAVLLTTIPMFPNLESFENRGETEIYHAVGSPNGAHALCIVGYARDPNPGGGVWIVKNSFGESWGHGGYGRIEWTDPHLRVEDFVMAVEEVRSLG